METIGIDAAAEAARATAELAESAEYSDTLGKQALIIWRRFRKNRFAVIGLAILALLYSASFAAPLVAPYPESGQPEFDIFIIDLPPIYSAYRVCMAPDGLTYVIPDRGKGFARGLDQLVVHPSAAEVEAAVASESWLLDAEGKPNRFRPNLFGRDELGRDVFSRALYAGRISLTIGFISVGIMVLIGTVWGCVAGYYGGAVDSIMMRVVDAIMCIPTFLLLVTVMSVFKPNIVNVMIVLGFTGWTTIARLVRAEFLSLTKRDFVEAARCVGAKDSRIIFRHVLPNAMGPIIVAATMGVAGAILAESGLSFFGLGVPPPLASWGNMLTNAQELNTMINAPWKAFYPGMLIFVTVLSFNFLGDGLRDALDPRLKNT